MLTVFLCVLIQKSMKCQIFDLRFNSKAYLPLEINANIDARSPAQSRAA